MKGQVGLFGLFGLLRSGRVMWNESETLRRYKRLGTKGKSRIGVGFTIKVRLAADRVGSPFQSVREASRGVGAGVGWGKSLPCCCLVVVFDPS